MGVPFSVTPEQLETFLKALALTGNVSASAEMAGTTRQTMYRHKDADLNFEIAWQHAMDQAIDELELEARRRGLDGYLEPVFQSGELVGYKRKYSDSLLIRQLEAHNPKYAKRVEHTGRDGGPIELSKVLDSIPDKSGQGEGEGG